MTVETIPSFTPAAADLWGKLKPESKKTLLANVWCSHCGRSVTITNFSGVVKGEGLLLVGKCAECHGDVARVVEFG